MRRLVPLLALALLGCGDDAPPPVDTTEYVRPGVELEGAPDPAPAHPLPRFVDVTAEAGVDFVHTNGAFGKIWMPETLGAGGGFFDHDGDGDPDLLLLNSGKWPEKGGPEPSPRLYRNDGSGHFEDITAEVGLDAFTFYGMGFCAADYDGDGDPDLFLSGVGQSFLARNDGGRYVDASDTLRYDPEAASAVPDWSLGAAFFDADADGDLDLFVTNYVQWTPATDVYTSLDGRTKSYATPSVYEGQSCRLFENRAGALVEITREAGLYDPSGKSMGVVVDDFNGDRLPDLFVTNDTEANFLYINLGGRFEDRAGPTGCGYDESGRARAGMGTTTLDLENAGQPSVAIGNFSREPVSLYAKVGSSERFVFVDAAGKTRLSRPTLLSLTFGVLAADFDHDGYEDLMLANGHVEPEIARVQQDVTFAQAPQLFLNRAGRFEDASGLVGADFAAPAVGRALACADLEGDGDLDVLITVNGGPPRLLRNDLDSDRRALRVRLLGAGQNPDALGAEVHAQAGTQHLVRKLRTGGSYLAQSERVAHFGLGKTAAAEVSVRWPTGRSEPLGTLEAGYLYEVREGEGVVGRQAFAE